LLSQFFHSFISMLFFSFLLLALVDILPAKAGDTHVGAAACGKCHPGPHQTWSQSRHSKMVQPATRSSVQGDFSRGEITLRDQTFKLAERNGVYFITDSYLTPEPQEHRVDYTLGNRRIQHFLSTLPDGRVVVLPPSWDVLRKQWFHNLDIDDPDEAPGVQVQIWNKHCYSCHVSQEEKNFDSQTGRYQTVWQDFGTNCERCHGPGGGHVALHKTSQQARPVEKIVLQTRLDPARNTMVCAQCHSLRDTYAKGFEAGKNYYDFFLPILEFGYPPNGDPAYFPDGRTRRFSNDALGLWQSECFLRGGVTCLTCHREAHDTNIEKNPQLRSDRNDLCTGCHSDLSRSKEKAVAAHTRHSVGSTGRSCVECHMPRTVTSIKAQIRDHSISIPTPENTIRHNIPNGCNTCHQDRSAEWALQQMNDWYGTRSREKLIRRAEAFSRARRGDPASIPMLLAILANHAEGPIARANAEGHLSRFASDPTVISALEHGLDDSEPLVRAIAALSINPGPADREVAVPALARALSDPVVIVRVGALASLVRMGVRELPGRDGQRFNDAKKTYAARAEHYSDDGPQQLAAAKFYLLTEDNQKAIDSLELSLKLDPEAKAQYLLAYAYARLGQVSHARDILATIPPSDPQYSDARKLLNELLPVR
jgi:predicted CXXCH cytochrome family protein